MSFKTVASTLVLPKTVTPLKKIRITNLDRVHFPVYMTTVYFYKSDGSADFFSLDILTEALSAALVPFYPLAGRLQTDGDGRPHINCCGAGVLLVKVAADTIIIDDFLQESAPRINLLELVPKLDEANDPSTWPLATFQVTFFQCGGVSLGAAVHHHIADGPGWLHFINAWSDLARGVAPKLHPLFERTPLMARSPPTPTFSHMEYQSSPRLILPQKDETRTSLENEPGHRLALKMFKFSRESLQWLLKACDCSFTTRHETLAAHIWRCYCQACGLSPDQRTKMYVAIDGRSRLQPQIPQGYCGNAIFLATSMLTAGTLMEKPLSSIAINIHDAVVRMNDEYLRSAIDYLELIELELLRNTPNSMGSPNLVLISWAKLPIYEANFGWGKPLLMRPASSCEGVFIVMPNPTNDGSLTVYAPLQAHHMLTFQKLILDISCTHI